VRQIVRGRNKLVAHFILPRSPKFPYTIGCKAKFDSKKTLFDRSFAQSGCMASETWFKLKGKMQ